MLVMHFAKVYCWKSLRQLPWRVCATKRLVLTIGLKPCILGLAMILGHRHIPYPSAISGMFSQYQQGCNAHCQNEKNVSKELETNDKHTKNATNQFELETIRVYPYLFPISSDRTLSRTSQGGKETTVVWGDQHVLDVIATCFVLIYMFLLKKFQKPYRHGKLQCKHCKQIILQYGFWMVNRIQLPRRQPRLAGLPLGLGVVRLKELLLAVVPFQPMSCMLKMLVSIVGLKWIGSRKNKCRGNIQTTRSRWVQNCLRLDQRCRELCETEDSWVFVAGGFYHIYSI